MLLVPRPNEVRKVAAGFPSSGILPTSVPTGVVVHIHPNEAVQQLRQTFRAENAMTFYHDDRILLHRLLYRCLHAGPICRIGRFPIGKPFAFLPEPGSISGVLSEAKIILQNQSAAEFLPSQHLCQILRQRRLPRARRPGDAQHQDPWRQRGRGGAPDTDRRRGGRGTGALLGRGFSGIFGCTWISGGLLRKFVFDEKIIPPFP
mmetsp:Transcript_61822/g.135393  ORF Transcript_61822/g.135393 Transcript_61822/m.135393 type:complete len:204 (-) Transcript_61822:680-1291(-)